MVVQYHIEYGDEGSAFANEFYILTVICQDTICSVRSNCTLQKRELRSRTQTVLSISQLSVYAEAPRMRIP